MINDVWELAPYVRPNQGEVVFKLVRHWGSVDFNDQMMKQKMQGSNIIRSEDEHRDKIFKSEMESELAMGDSTLKSRQQRFSGEADMVEGVGKGGQ